MTATANYTETIEHDVFRAEVRMEMVADDLAREIRHIKGEYILEQLAECNDWQARMVEGQLGLTIERMEEAIENLSKGGVVQA